MNKTNKPNSKPHCVRAGGSTVIVQSRRHKGEVRETFRELVDSTHKPGLILPPATARTAQQIKGTQYPTAVTAISCHLWANARLAWQSNGRAEDILVLRVKRDKRYQENRALETQKGISFLSLLLWGLEGGKHPCDLWHLANGLSVVLYCTSPLYVRECQKSRASLGALN